MHGSVGDATAHTNHPCSDKSTPTHPHIHSLTHVCCGVYGMAAHTVRNPFHCSSFLKKLALFNQSLPGLRLQMNTWTEIFCLISFIIVCVRVMLNVLGWGANECNPPPRIQERGNYLLADNAWDNTDNSSWNVCKTILNRKSMCPSQMNKNCGRLQIDVV